MVKTKDLLPPDLQGDKNIEGLCAAADEVFSLENSLDVLLVYVIDNVPADVLPFLAWQFHVEGWEFAQTESERRNLIKSSIELHRYKGTPWAIEHAIETLGFKSEVVEWFKYSGNPYYFKVAVDISKHGGVDQQLIKSIESLIDHYKNERSWLDALILYIPTNGIAPKCTCAVLFGEGIEVYPYKVTTVEISGQKPTFIGGLTGVEEITINPQ